MDKIDQLIKSWKKFLEVPWRENLSPDQRVIFCIYDEKKELRLRAKVEEFELATQQAGYRWKLIDITDYPALWLSREEYKEELFRQPALIRDLLPGELLEFIDRKLSDEIQDLEDPAKTVVSLLGAGSLYGFVKVREVVDLLAPKIEGRLMVFFPGVHENQNYRLLNAYDGWNYHAVPITSD